MYKVIGKNNIFNILDTVIENRKIQNKDRFLDTSKKDILNFNLLKNMGLAVDMFKKHQSNKESKTTVLVDSDP